MPAPHALYSKMLAERTASRNVLSFILFYFILFYFILFYFIYFIRLTGLRGAAHLNGREGVVRGEDPANHEC
jgi:hypothetical protein